MTGAQSLDYAATQQSMEMRVHRSSRAPVMTCKPPSLPQIGTQMIALRPLTSGVLGRIFEPGCPVEYRQRC
jgi:hypothetical protein